MSENSLSTEIVERPEDRSPRPRSTSQLVDGGMLGPYQILGLLGEGGGGRVYRAVHTRLDRLVAIKVLRSEHANKTNRVRRFFQEARAANQIAHENIVEITDLVTDGNDNSYIIMELLEGESLEVLQEREGILPLTRSMAIAKQVCSALAAAHEVGIVHRDLKPGNVFLSDNGRRKDFVKLLDFGVAKLSTTEILLEAQEEVADWKKTLAGSLLGTPDYMSPEQANGDAVDHRADIYSLGVMLYEMVTGSRPFMGGTLEDTLEAHRTKMPEAPSTVTDLPHVIPAELEKMIVRMLAKNPEDRPQSCKEIEAVIDIYVPFDDISVPEFTQLSGSYSTIQAVPPNRTRPAFIAFTLGILTAAIGYAVLSREEAPTVIPAVPQTAPIEAQAEAPTKKTTTPAVVPVPPEPVPETPAVAPEPEPVEARPAVAPAKKKRTKTKKRKRRRRVRRAKRGTSKRTPIARDPDPIDRNGVIDPF